jgi:hypothetical protein
MGDEEGGLQRIQAEHVLGFEVMEDNSSIDLERGDE